MKGYAAGDPIVVLELTEEEAVLWLDGDDETLEAAEVAIAQALDEIDEDNPDTDPA